MRQRTPVLVCLLSAVGACIDVTASETQSSIEAQLAQINALSFFLAAPASAASQTIGLPELIGPISACPFDTASTFFTCPKASIAIPGAAFDSLTRKYQLMTPTLVALSAYDVKTVGSVRVIHDRSALDAVSDATGTTTFATTTHADLTLAGLLTATRLANGSGITTVVQTSPTQVTTHATTFTLTNIVPSPNPSGFVTPNWPNSGTVLYQYVETLQGSPPDTVTIDLTFTSPTAASYLKFHAGASAPGTCTLERTTSFLVSANCALTP